MCECASNILHSVPSTELHHQPLHVKNNRAVCLPTERAVTGRQAAHANEELPGNPDFCLLRLMLISAPLLVRSATLQRQSLPVPAETTRSPQQTLQPAAYTPPGSAHDFPPSPKLESYVADDSSFLASLSFRAAFMKSCSAQRCCLSCSVPVVLPDTSTIP